MNTPLTDQEIEELRIAIAEEMGWQYKPFRSGEPATWIRPNGNPVGHMLRELPYYTTSLDAIQQAAMERFKGDDARRFQEELDALFRGIATRHEWQLTALDWAIAFARTAKIWRYKV